LCLLFGEIKPAFQKHYPCRDTGFDTDVNLVNNAMGSDAEAILDALKVYQPQHGTWRIVGKDLDGEILTIICGVDDGVVIVTIF